MRRARLARPGPPRSEVGAAAMIVVVLAGAVMAVAVVTVIDTSAYLVAARRAQAAADAGALAAAVAAHPDHRPVTNPLHAALAVVAHDEVSMVRCDCRPGSAEVEVTTRALVQGVFAHTFGATTITASARARVLEVHPHG